MILPWGNTVTNAYLWGSVINQTFLGENEKPIPKVSIYTSVNGRPDNFNWG